MIVRNLGFNRIELRWRQDRRVEMFDLYEVAADGSRKLLTRTADNHYQITVPVALSKKQYAYELVKQIDTYRFVEPVETSKTDYCQDLLPMVVLPERPQWEAIYRKAWQVTWRAILTSPALPFPHAYNDYPDCDVTYLWDTCFCTLFQRYAALQGIHPCMSTLDNFYALMQEDGYIPRNFWCASFKSMYQDKKQPVSINPPLPAWAEWNYYQIAGDRERLARVLPILVKHYAFIDGFLMDAPGFYRWDAGGEGWDNLNWEQGADTIEYYVELPAQQALAAEIIALIAKEVGDSATAERFRKEWEAKRGQMASYWNAGQNWYCSLTKDRRFTRKTLNGMWPLLAGLVDAPTAQTLVQRTLLDPKIFNTSPMPLPTVAKDEPGYNPKGEYWLGGVWLNISLMVVQALERYGMSEPALDLTQRTLDAVAATYERYASFPQSLWECYAPEAVGPASHKTVRKDEVGGVREEFAGWTCVIINLLIENVLGFSASAPRNELTWRVRLTEEHGIERLRFGNVTTSLRASKRAAAGDPMEAVIQSTAPYTLIVENGSRRQSVAVPAGTSRLKV